MIWIQTPSYAPALLGKVNRKRHVLVPAENMNGAWAGVRMVKVLVWRPEAEAKPYELQSPVSSAATPRAVSTTSCLRPARQPPRSEQWPEDSAYASMTIVLLIGDARSSLPAPNPLASTRRHPPQAQMRVRRILRQQVLERIPGAPLPTRRRHGPRTPIQ